MLNTQSIFITAFLFVAFCLTLNAQKQVVPGYQGKRMSIGLYYNVMSTTAGPNARGINIYGDPREAGENSSKPFAMSGRFDLNFSYVLSRRFTGSFEIGYGQTGLTQAISIQPTNTQSFRNSGIYRIGYSYAAIGIQMQRKKRWGIAPIGPYWGLRYTATRSQNAKLILIDRTGDEGHLAFKDCDCTNIEPIDEETRESIFKSKIYHNFEIQFGLKNIIKQHYFYDFAISTAPAGYYAFNNDDFDNFDTRLKRLLSINARFGVGILF